VFLNFGARARGRVIWRLREVIAVLRHQSRKGDPSTLAALCARANPIENVWEYLRANKLAITVFDDYDDIVDKTCEARFHHRTPLGNGQSLRPLV
jgi:hypothetical protein